MLSNAEIQDDDVSPIKLDPLHLDNVLFLKTFYDSVSFVPSLSSKHTKFNQFTVNGKPLSLVDQFVEAYKHKHDESVPPLKLIKMIMECSKYKELGNLQHMVCLTRHDIVQYFASQILITATFNMHIILYSKTLDTSVVFQLPCIVELSLRGKIDFLRNNLRIAFQPTYDSFSPIDKLKKNLVIALVGTKESLGEDIEASALSAAQKTELLGCMDRIIRLSSGLLPGTPFTTETNMVLKSLNEQVALEVNLKGIGGRILGRHEPVLITIEDHVAFKRAGYGMIWRHSLFAFGAASEITTAVVGAGEGCLDGSVAVAQADVVAPELSEVTEAGGCVAGAIVGGTTVANYSESIDNGFVNATTTAATGVTTATSNAFAGVSNLFMNP